MMPQLATVSKIAIVDRTGLPDAPLARTLHERGHHVALVTGARLRGAGFFSSPTRFEVHRVPADDSSQLTTAFQHADAIVVCRSDHAPADALTEQQVDRAIASARLMARVPRLLHLRLERPRPARPATRRRPATDTAPAPRIAAGPNPRRGVAA